MSKKIEEEEFEFDFDNVFKAVNSYKKFLIPLVIILILIITWHVRTRCLPNLHGEFLLGLDPYVFMRYGQQIVDSGSIWENDTLRYYPTGFDPSRELLMPSYSIAFLYNVMSIFSSSLTVMEVSIIYPVIVTCIAMIFFFLMAKEFFDNTTAIISSLLLSVVNGFVFRTSAGFAEKEPIAMMFIFPMIYFIIKAIKTKDIKKKIIFSLLSGIGVVGSLLSWGGVNFTFISLGFMFLILIFLGISKRSDSIVYAIFLFSIIFSTFLNGRNGSAITIMKHYMIIYFPIALFLNLFIYELFPKIKNLVLKYKPKSLSEHMYSILIGTLVLFLITLIYPGIHYYYYFFTFILERSNNPFGTDAFATSVNENQAPYFYDPVQHVDWWTPMNYTFFTMLFGSFLLFYEMMKKFKKSRVVLTITYVLSIVLFIFSRFSTDEKYSDITAFFSQSFFGLGMHHIVLLIFAVYLVFFFIKNNKKIDLFKKIRPDYLFIFIWFFLTSVGARGGVRIIFAVCPPAMMLSGYFFKKSFDFVANLIESKTLASTIYIAAAILIIFNFMIASQSNANFYSSFTGEWNEAMQWVQLNTPLDSVFTHWWDYGYWVQTMGNRTTTLDGGNYDVALDHLVGRYMFASQIIDENGTYDMSEPATSLVTDFGSPEYFLVIDDDVLKYVQMGRIGKRPAYYTLGIPEQVTENTLDFVNSSLYPSLIVYSSIYSAFPVQEDFFYNDFLFQASSTYIINLVFPYISSDNTYDFNNIYHQGYAAVYNHYYNPNNVEIIPMNCYCNQSDQCYFYRDDGIPECTLILDDGLVLIPKNASNNLFTQLYLLNATVPGFEIAYDNDKPLSIQGMASQSYTDIKIYSINYEELEEFVLDEPLPNYWRVEGGAFW